MVIQENNCHLTNNVELIIILQFVHIVGKIDYIWDINPGKQKCMYCNKEYTIIHEVNAKDKLKYNDMKICFIDIETTGTDIIKNAIHQISGMIVIDGEVKETFDIKFRPFDGAVISPQALMVSGLTPDDVMQYPDMKESFNQFISILDKYISKYNPSDKFFFAGYNCQAFDSQFIRRLFVINNNNYYGSYFWANTLDVMVLATVPLVELRHTMKDFKQCTVAKHLGIKIDDNKLHDALYDIELCKKIFDLITQ